MTRPLIHEPAVRWVLFLICLAAMLYGTFRPTPPPDLFAHSDKFGHVIGMAALTVSARMAMARLPGYLLWSAIAALAYGLEFLQAAWRPLRIFSPADAYANLSGVAIALGLVLLWRIAGRPYGLPVGCRQ